MGAAAHVDPSVFVDHFADVQRNVPNRIFRHHPGDVCPMVVRRCRIKVAVQRGMLGVSSIPFDQIVLSYIRTQTGFE